LPWTQANGHKKEKKSKDYAFWRPFYEKPSISPGCPIHWACHVPKFATLDFVGQFSFMLAFDILQALLSQPQYTSF